MEGNKFYITAFMKMNLMNYCSSYLKTHKNKTEFILLKLLRDYKEVTKIISKTVALIFSI